MSSTSYWRMWCEIDRAFHRPYLDALGRYIDCMAVAAAIVTILAIAAGLVGAVLVLTLGAIPFVVMLATWTLVLLDAVLCIEIENSLKLFRRAARRAAELTYLAVLNAV